VEVNLLESMIGLCIEPITNYFATGRPIPVYQRAATSQAYNLTCKDGKRIGLHASMLDKFWQRLCRAVGREDWVSEYPARADRIAHYERLASELSGIFRTRDRDEWITVLERADIPFAPENELQDLENDPQVRHLDVFYETEHPQHGRVKAPHRPVRLDGSREIDFRPPPVLGEHTEEVLREVGVAPERIAELRANRVI
jgi:crotonobetainyl-CoA:carnitine CoA-transferase CaiB-like acyl-CoA transferase